MIGLFSKSLNIVFRRESCIVLQRAFGRKRVVDDFVESIDIPEVVPEVPNDLSRKDIALKNSKRSDEMNTKEVVDSFHTGQYKISHKITSDSILNEDSLDNLEELKTCGLSDLQDKKSTDGNRKGKRTFQTKELLSHVPQELSVVKYGYVDNRVLGVLENILDNGDFISSKSLNAISIVSMELEDDGKDINIHYRLKKSDSLVNDDDFSIFQIANNRYIEKPHRHQVTKKNISQLKKEKERLESTYKYRDFRLTLDDVSIIDEIQKSTKGIRYELCRQLNIKRVPQIHFIHDVK